MASTDIKDVLWQNVAALMQARWGKENLNRLAAEAKIGLATTTRIKNRKTSIGINVVSKIAQTFDLEPWVLLTPGLDPQNPPVVFVSKREADVNARLRAAFKDLVEPDK